MYVVVVLHGKKTIIYLRNVSRKTEFLGCNITMSALIFMSKK